MYTVSCKASPKAAFSPDDFAIEAGYLSAHSPDDVDEDDEGEEPESGDDPDDQDGDNRHAGDDGDDDEDDDEGSRAEMILMTNFSKKKI